MSWWDKVKEFLHKAFEWLGSDQSHEMIDTAAQIMGIIVKVIAAMNREPDAPEKREAARHVLKFVETATPEQLRIIADLKATGTMPKLRSHERDILTGAVIGSTVKQMKDGAETKEIDGV